MFGGQNHQTQSKDPDVSVLFLIQAEHRISTEYQRCGIPTISCLILIQSNTQFCIKGTDLIPIICGIIPNVPGKSVQIVYLNQCIINNTRQSHLFNLKLKAYCHNVCIYKTSKLIHKKTQTETQSYRISENGVLNDKK